MASPVRTLQPIAASSDERLYTQLATLEARVAALEAQRGLNITPLGGFAASGATVSNAGYTWRGGRVYVMWWGQVTALPMPPTQLGIVLFINGNSMGVSSQTTSGNEVDGGTFVTAPHFVQLSNSVWVPAGPNTIGFGRLNTNVSSWSATALAFEWPQA